MKFNKILALCKKLDKVILITDRKSNTQYLSNGVGIYPMLGIPFCTIENVKNLLGLNDNQRDTWAFSEMVDIDEMYTSDADTYEEKIEPYFFSVKTSAAEIFVYKSSIGLIAVDKAYIDAVSCKGDTEMYLRIKGLEKTVIVKSGLINYRAIAPISLKRDEKTAAIRDAYNQLELSIQND